MSNYVIVNGELYHHGIKGMKWGQRRYQNKDGSLTPAGKKRYSDVTQDVMKKKAEYKTAKKAYNKAFNKADTWRHEAFSLNKDRRAANDKRWDEALEKGIAADKAKAKYKAAKQKEKTAIKKTANELEKKASLGEKLVYNEATRKKAASYIVKNNMSVEEATKKAKGDAWRNTAIFVAAYGAIGAASIYAMNR